MGVSVPVERDHFVDLECGRTIVDPVQGDCQSKGLNGKLWNGGVNFDGSLKGESLCDVFLNSVEANVGKVEVSAETNLGGEENVGLGEKGATGQEKPKKKRCKKAPKPPRPPKPPLLDATDQKLVREITEIAMLKRARIERIKALRKIKASKATSSGGNTCALVVTIIFCLIIIFQGAFSRSNRSTQFHGSPELGAETTLISIQYNKNASAGSNYSPSSGSPNIVEQISGSGTIEAGDRAPG